MSELFDLAVIGAAGDVASAAAVEALAAGARPGAPLVLGWPAHRAGAALVPGAATARRLAGALRARELDAVARGRIAYCSLGREDPLGIAARAAAVARGPVILAIHGARDLAADALLEHSGVVVLAGSLDPVVAELAAAELTARGLAVRAGRAPIGPLASLLARGGVIAAATVGAAREVPLR